MRDPETLVAHRPPMLLLASVLETGPGTVKALARVDPGGWYADGEGAMPGWFGIELMAQTVAAFSGALMEAEGREPRTGYLLGTRAYLCSLPSFPAGAELVVDAKLQYSDELGLSAFQCRITLEGEEIATALLKTYEAP
jgi:predicted hotdog family 3-hydroxylacyl-ACP dehydratase